METSQQRHAARPNIILILTDDQGYWSLGCAGNREIRTPHIDALAQGGARLDNFFCASPVCSPARASILTGRIPSQHGVADWIRCGHGEKPGDAPIQYLDGIAAYPELLAENGYVCGHSGKWHLGATGTPQKGFSHWFTTLGGSGAYRDATVCRDGEQVATNGYLTDVITDDALAFIDARCDARDGKPFYLNLCYTAPHSPHVDQHKPEYVQYYYDNCAFADVPQDKRSPASIHHPHDIAYSLTFASPQREFLTLRDLLSGYYAAVQGVDDGVGRVMAKLRERGIEGNTLVIYTSDNGFNCGQHGIWGKGNCTFPLNMYDTSVKVPCIFHAPGRIRGGVTSDCLLSAYDIMPTLLEFADVPNPEAVNLPGRSFAALLREGGAGDADNVRCRSVTVFDEYGPTRMIRTKAWKYIHRVPYGPHELYDLANDPAEQFNLLDENRYFVHGPAFIQAQAARMKADMDAWFLRYVNPEIDGAAQPVYGRGQLCRLGAVSEGRTAFSPLSDVEYKK